MTAKAPIRRCAVYTRKSSEEGLEQDFNSLMRSGKLARPSSAAKRQTVGYIFGLASNSVLLRQVGRLAEDAALGRLDGEGEKVRRWGVCHERTVCVQGYGTVREMKEGPSRPAVRCRSQATASRCRQERWW